MIKGKVTAAREGIEQFSQEKLTWSARQSFTSPETEKMRVGKCRLCSC